MMSRFLLIFWFLFGLAHSIKSQPKQLASRITEGLTTDKQKVDAIFNWVIDNIEYDTEALDRWTNGLKIYPEFDIEANDDTIAWHKQYNDSVANLVIQRKKALCDGYATLFKSLCNYSQIQCEIISGKAKQPLRDIFQPHAWNAVRIQDKWYLFDTTWASGYVTDSFHKEKNLTYYFTAPEKMFVNHFPNDLRWTLLDKSYNFERFINSPIEDIRVIENGLTNYYPKNKTIMLQKGQVITVWLEFDKSPTLLNISISEHDQETKASKLDIVYTENTYDSLLKIDPDFFEVIKKIEVVKKIVQNKIIKPLTTIKGFQIHVEYGLPALDYVIVYKNK